MAASSLMPMDSPKLLDTPSSDKTLVFDDLTVLTKDAPPTNSRENVNEKANLEPSAIEATESTADGPVFKKDLAFWMVMLSLSVGLFMTAMELTGVSTALPIIARDLEAKNFTWIASAYALASTCWQPVFGGMAVNFGRKPILLASIALFSVGVILCGSAKGETQMIVGRTVQGCGAGGIMALTDVVVADLVPLSERGLILGLISLVWAFSAAIGPIIGAAFAEHDWRWFFYINLPIAGIAMVLVFTCMHLHTPALTLGQKLTRLDWPGIVLFTAGSASLMVGLTWGGDQYAWKSAPTLVSIIGGSAVLVFFVFYEKLYARYPIVPNQILGNRTSLAGFISCLLASWVALTIFYYFPFYFQAVQGRSPIKAAIDIFPMAFTIAPAAVCAGVYVKKTQKYRGLIVGSWILTVAGAGVLLLVKADASRALAMGLQLPVSVGVGILFAITKVPVVAPLPPSLNAQAMSFFMFCRSFGSVLGITFGSLALQNELKKKLPTEVLERLPTAAAAFTAIPEIVHLPQPLRGEVQEAFSDSIHIIWFVMIGVAAAGLLSSLMVRNYRLGSVTDKEWGQVHAGKTKAREARSAPGALA